MEHGNTEARKHGVKRIEVIRLLLDALDEAYDRRSWHGTNLRGSLRGLSRDVLRWRPATDRHNVWELVVHAAYWKLRHPQAADG